jgi:hypothetical protein
MNRPAAGSQPESGVRADDVTLERAIRRLNARAWGISVGLIGGLALFIATNVLVFKGGPYVGQHLGLLRAYFPGYSVTFVGSLVGFVYMFVIGYGLGRVVGTVYNKLVEST